LSYDSPAILKSFAERKDISYPLLSDPESKVIQAFGILNTSAPKGPFYGIPYPGTFILDSKGTITAKYFEENYSERVTASDILIRQFSAAGGAAHQTIDAKHLRLSTSASLGVVRSGQRLALVLDIELKPRIHVYAPGVQGYIPIAWTLKDSPSFRAHEIVYPTSKKLHLPAINETVPVYTDRIRVFREVTIASDGKVKPVLNQQGELVIEGTLRYQACDDEKCFIPEDLPLKWTLRFEGHDTQRAPSELRRK
jgi:DsbC/DsbD-like thiol-disulfide interchange protein